jgi:hypothetical protein
MQHFGNCPERQDASSDKRAARRMTLCSAINTGRQASDFIRKTLRAELRNPLFVLKTTLHRLRRLTGESRDPSAVVFGRNDDKPNFLMGRNRPNGY